MFKLSCHLTLLLLGVGHGRSWSGEMIFGSLRQRLAGFSADYLTVLRHGRGRLLPVLALMLGSALLDLLGVSLIPVFIGLFLSRPAAGHALQSALGLEPVGIRTIVVWVGGVLVGVYVAKAYATYWLQRRLLQFGEAQRSALIATLMARLLSRDWQYHLRTNSSEMLSNMLWHTSTYSNSMLTASLRLMTDGLVAVALCVFLAATNLPAVMALTLLIVAVFAASSGFIRPRLTSAMDGVRVYSGRLMLAANHGLGALREIRVLGCEQHFSDQVAIACRHLAESTVRQQTLSLLPRQLIEVAVVTFLVLLAAIQLFTQNDPETMFVTLGAFGAAAVRLMPAVTSLIANSQAVRASRSSLGLLARALGDDTAPLALSPTVIAQGVGASVAAQSFRSLRFVNVSFAYEGTTKAVVSDVSLEIRAGDVVGLTGRSGTGKSTLADLMLGLLAPAAGKILVDDMDLKGDIAAWKRRAAYIPQSVYLIDDTLRRNIAFGVPDSEASQARIEESMDQAQLRDLVDSLPAGLDTVVGERGIRLSGGQKQRIALARALFHDRDFIVLDEATSALDVETERLVVAAVRALRQKTLVIIAHRDSALQGCGRLLRVEDGSVLELGADATFR